MKKFPKRSLMACAAHSIRAVAALHIGIYAANASFFILLAVFPALLLVLGILRYMALEPRRLMELLQPFMPHALLGPVGDLIRLAGIEVDARVLGFSALGTVWSSGRGVYGLITGLNAVYGAAETRGYLHRRLLGVGYTLVFALVLVVTVGLQVFSAGLLPQGMEKLRFVMPLALQILVFCAMFLALPNRKGTLAGCLPGAVLSAAGWLLFSRLYGVYVAHFAPLTNVYGSVYAVALCMLWLYCCMAILLFGGALNGYLERSFWSRFKQ